REHPIGRSARIAPAREAIRTKRTAKGRRIAVSPFSFPARCSTEGGAPAMEQNPGSESVRLGTPRLILRAPEMRDAPSITAGLNDFEVASMLARVPAPYRLKHARAWL